MLDFSNLKYRKREFIFFKFHKGARGEILKILQEITKYKFRHFLPPILYCFHKSIGRNPFGTGIGIEFVVRWQLLIFMSVGFK